MVIQEIDPYGVLGVLPSAEIYVIKAAYRALAQRYHPDRVQDPEDAGRMAEVNAAYSILSDPTAREEWDKSRLQARIKSDDDASNATTDWEIAARYFPQVAAIYRDLSKVSKGVALSYRTFLVKSKMFSEAETMAADLEQAYLRKRFGDDPGLQQFGKKLLVEGNRSAARELHRIVTVLGKALDARAIEAKIKTQFALNRRRRPTPLAPEVDFVLRRFEDSPEDVPFEDALECLGGTMSREPARRGSLRRLLARRDIVVVLQGRSRVFRSRSEVVAWGRIGLRQAFEKRWPDFEPAGEGAFADEEEFAAD